MTLSVWRLGAGRTEQSPHDTCSKISTSHSGASIITSCPAVVVSNVCQVLSVLHSASALSNAA